MARLTRVRRIHESDRDTRITGPLLDTPGEARKRLVVKPAVHPLAVIEMFTNVRQVFENDNRILEPSSVLDGFAGGLLHDVCQDVLVVVESFVHAPSGFSRLKTAGCGEHLFAEVASMSAVEQHRLGRSTVSTGTTRQEFGFSNVEADRCRVVRLFWFRDLVLDGDLKHPRGAVLSQPELPDRHVAVGKVVA